jgi:hypothetical protein
MVLGQLEPQMEKIELISSLVHRFTKSAQRLLMVSWIRVFTGVSILVKV